MGTDSAIAWTDATWNPVTGCTKVSPGCANCYAENVSLRQQRMGTRKYRNGFKVTLHPEVVQLPVSWNKPRLVFVNSMSDLFHPDIPDDFIESVFEVMEDYASQHTYQILTKRPHRMFEFVAERYSHGPVPDNIWLGTSVENSAYMERIDIIRLLKAKVRFISFEPLLAPLPDDLDLTGIQWIIVGGESGHGCRPMKKEWVMSLMNSARRCDARFFFKQWGGPRPGGQNTLDGVKYEEYPI